jgi:hypothetical protein
MGAFTYICTSCIIVITILMARALPRGLIISNSRYKPIPSINQGKFLTKTFSTSGGY